MVAFWRDFTVRPGPDGQPGPSRPFPAPGTSRAFTWNDAFDLGRAAGAGQGQGEGQGERQGKDKGKGKGGAKAAAGGLVGRAAAALGLGQGGGGGELALAPALPVAPIWEDVDRAANEAAGCALSGLAGLPDYALCFQGF